MGDSVIEVNEYGLRAVDEKRNYNDRTMAHFYWDPQKAEWMNMLLFLIYDQRTATLWQGFPPLPVQGQPAPYVITGNTMDELARNIEARLAQLAPKTGGFSLDKSFAGNVSKTMARFNEFAANGVDEDFHRGDFAYEQGVDHVPADCPGR